MPQESLQSVQADTSSSVQVMPQQSVTGEDRGASETDTDVVAAERQRIRALGKVMQQEANNRVLRVLLLALAPILVMLALRLGLGEEGFSQVVTDPTYLIPLFLTIGVGLPLTAFRKFQKARVAARTLAAQDDLQAIGPLITALQFAEDTRVSEPAFLALVRLLPRMQASDASLLTDAHRFFLCQTLSVAPGNSLFLSGDLFRFTPLFRSGSREKPTPGAEGLSRLNRRKRDQEKAHADFQIAVLKAFEQVGDSKALPVVERLAHREAKTEAEQRVCEAAQACLPFLQVRTERHRAHQTLLRASHPTEADPGSLLRATGVLSDTDPTTLLRPTATSETP